MLQSHIKGGYVVKLSKFYLKRAIASIICYGENHLGVLSGERERESSFYRLNAKWLVWQTTLKPVTQRKEEKTARRIALVTSVTK